MTIRLTEVEAYEGAADPGSHAYRGVRPRNRTMFGPAGHLYAYFTYGMHTCANLVCGVEGEPSAVLLRAGEVVDGLPIARSRRPAAPDRDLARGPARLAVALGIRLADDGADVLGQDAWRLDLDAVDPTRVRTGPRVGVSGEGGTAAFPWRFHLEGEPTVSPYRAAVRRVRSG